MTARHQQEMVFPRPKPEQDTGQVVPWDTVQGFDEWLQHLDEETRIELLRQCAVAVKQDMANHDAGETRGAGRLHCCSQCVAMACTYVQDGLGYRKLHDLPAAK